MKTHSYIPLLLSIATTMLLSLSCSDSQVVLGGTGTETVGILVNKSGDPVKNAEVTLTDLSDSTTFESSSDSTGEYIFTDLRDGIYSLWAMLEDSSLITYRDNFNFDSGTTDLGIDTMKAPGAIKGVALANNIPKELIEIDITGTSYSATTNSEGHFVMYPVLPGTYKIHFRYQDDNKEIIFEKDIDSVVVNWEDTTNIDTVNLDVKTDGTPASPDSLQYSYDTLTETLSLWWSKSISPDISKYSIHLDDGDNIETIEYSNDTCSRIELSSYLTDKDSARVTIFIHSIDSGNNSSTVASPSVNVKLVASKFVKTVLDWKIFPKPLPIDTSIAGKPTTLAISFNNPTRKIKSILWYNMSNFDTLGISYPDMNEGTDTINHIWDTKGEYKIRVEAIDEAGKFWFSTIDTLHIYDSTELRPENQWIVSNEELNFRRKEHTSTILGNRLMVLGGTIDIEIDKQKYPSILNTIETSTLSSDVPSSWITTDSLPKPLRHSTTLSFDGKVFIIGGLEPATNSFPINASSLVHVFDSTTSGWSEYDILDQKLFGMSACILNGDIYITGGVDNNYKQSKNIYKLDTDLMTCEKVGELTEAKAYHQSVSDGVGIYTFGGLLYGETNALKKVEYFSPDSGSKSIKEMPQERMFFGAEIVNGKIYIFGGIDSYIIDGSDNTAFSSVDYFDLQTKEWKQANSIPSGLHSFSTSSYNGMIYLIGGSNQFPSETESKKIYCYYPFKEERSK